MTLDSEPGQEEKRHQSFPSKRFPALHKKDFDKSNSRQNKGNRHE
jgi:hypothetical protein